MKMLSLHFSKWVHREKVGFGLMGKLSSPVLKTKGSRAVTAPIVFLLAGASQGS